MKPTGELGDVTKHPASSQTEDVPTQVFSTFLEALLAAGTSQTVIERLRTALLDDQKYSERALTTALFGEESLL